jgi:uncharacterized membrane protein
MSAVMPKTIKEYLAQVRAALGKADPALIQDALYDAEEHLRSEMAEHPEIDEATLIAKIASSYGSPEEVAEIYRDTEVRVTRALRTPRAAPRQSALGRFFGVAADPRTYAALFYMLLSLATGIFYFTWAVTGISLSFGLSILIIGLPFALLFLGTVRVLSLVEGRLVEVMLGVRMPRRPTYSQRGVPFGERIKNMITDWRTWSTLLYMLMMLPLGIIYFTVVVTGLSIALAFSAAPFLWLFAEHRNWNVSYDGPIAQGPASVILCVVGIALLFSMLHLARGVGKLHGQVAKQLLVESGAKDDEA